MFSFLKSILRTALIACRHLSPAFCLVMFLSEETTRVCINISRMRPGRACPDGPCCLLPTPFFSFIGLPCSYRNCHGCGDMYGRRIFFWADEHVLFPFVTASDMAQSWCIATDIKGVLSKRRDGLKKEQLINMEKCKRSMPSKQARDSDKDIRMLNKTMMKLNIIDVGLVRENGDRRTAYCLQCIFTPFYYCSESDTWYKNNIFFPFSKKA